MVAWFPENMDSLVEIQGQTSVAAPCRPMERVAQPSGAMTKVMEQD